MVDQFLYSGWFCFTVMLLLTVVIWMKMILAANAFLSGFSWLLNDFGLGHQGTTNCHCGTAGRGRGRIVGGTESRANRYPFILAVIDKQTRRQFCGAVIISEVHALTAAHCTRGAKGRELAVIAGAHDLRTHTNSVQESVVSHHLDHEEYLQSNSTVVNDLSILYLRTPLRYNSHVIPICVPNHETIDWQNKNIKIIGWGQTSAKSPTSPVLQEVSVRVLRHRECQAMIGRRYQTSQTLPTKVCTLSPGKGACMGDSGGPVIWFDPEINRYTLVGLVSFGDPNCDPNTPTVHTNVAPYLPWIRSATGRDFCYKI